MLNQLYSLRMCRRMTSTFSRSFHRSSSVNTCGGKYMIPRYTFSTYRDPNSSSGDSAFKTITTKPTTPEEIAEYERLQARDEADAQTRRLIQDMEDDGVFVNEPEFKEIEISMNADGSFTFKSAATGSSASTQAPEPKPETEKAVEKEDENIKIDDPRLIISLTCDVCNHRMTKSMPKRSYEKGVVLLRCDGCRSNHLIADNLGWFGNENVNVEMLMREKGEQVIRTNNIDDENIDAETKKAIEKAMEEATEQKIAQPPTDDTNTDTNEPPKSLQ